MRSINWTKLLTRAGLRLLIAAVCAAICVAEFKSRTDNGIIIFFTGIAAFLLFSRTLDVIVEERTGVQILSASPLVGIPILYFAIRAKEGMMILFGAVYTLCMVPMILVQVRRGGKNARKKQDLGGEEMERQDRRQNAAEDALFDEMDKRR